MGLSLESSIKQLSVAIAQTDEATIFKILLNNPQVANWRCLKVFKEESVFLRNVNYDKRKVIELVINFVDFNDADNLKNYLKLAATSDNCDVRLLESLLKNGLRVDGINAYDIQLFIRSVFYEKGIRKHTLKLLLDGGLVIGTKPKRANKQNLLHDLIDNVGKDDHDAWEIASLLLKSGISVNEPNYNGSTPLLRSISTENYSLTSYLIRAGADVNAKGIHGIFPLFLAVRYEYLRLVNLLILKGADVNAKTDDGKTAMSEAESLPIVKTLLKNGTNMDAEDDATKACMLVALLKKPQYFSPTFIENFIFDNTLYHCDKVRKALIIYFRSCAPNFAKRVLDRAMDECNVNLVEILLVSGARFHKPWNIRLYLDLIFSDRAVLKLMLSRGLDVGPGFKTANGQGILHYLIDYIGKTNINAVEIANDLFCQDPKPPVNEVNDTGLTPLLRCIDKEDEAFVTCLIENGADVNRKSHKGISALHIAVRYQKIHLVRLILQRGADVNDQSNDGTVALSEACYSCNDKLISLLVQKGAAVCIEDKIGRTPMSWLNPRVYSYDACVDIMIKEISKLLFKKLPVHESDVNIIREKYRTKTFFEMCLIELELMSNTKFFESHSYLSVLESQNLKKLASLTENKEFVSKFYENLHIFICYKNDLTIIFEEALQMRDLLEFVDSKYYSMFIYYYLDLEKKIKEKF